MQSTEQTNACLYRPEDSEDWEPSIQWQSRIQATKQLWDLITIQEPLIENPVAPRITDFVRTTTVQESSHSTRQASKEEDGSRTSRCTQQSGTLITELSSDQRATFQLTCTIYQDQNKHYSAQIDTIAKLKDLISKTVSPSYQRTCCQPTESVGTWYA